MATTDAGCGMDDMALWRGSPGDVARAKAPTRSPAVATLGRAMASTLPAGSPPPRAVTAIPDRIPLYDLHHVYRV